jgi:adenylate kinase family enzyme
MQRVSLVGPPGSGKTTVGRKLAASLEVPFVELDAIFHQPGWAELSRDDFRERVSDALTARGWVVDGNYSAVRDLVWDRADTVVWLDLGRWLVMRRVVLRTVRRAVTRERLWNGNREPLTSLYRLNPEKNIISWTWVKYPAYVARYGAAMRDPAYNHLRFLRLRTAHEIGWFLASACRPANERTSPSSACSPARSRSPPWPPASGSSSSRSGRWRCRRTPPPTGSAAT